MMIFIGNFSCSYGLLVALAAFAVYANTLANGFVWDDDVVILANQVLNGSAFSLFSGIDGGRVTETTPYYRPLTLLSFLIEGRLHSFTPYLVRLFNVLLHSCNVFLVYNLARTLRVNLTGALFAALLFAIHPLQSEAVNFNAGGRNTLLAAFFVLASYLVHRSSVISNNTGALFVGAVLFLAGLFSKETAIAVLPFIVAAEVTDFRGAGRSIRQVLFRLVPYISSLALYFVLRDNALSKAGVILKIMPGLAARLLDNIFIIPRYLLNVVWPGFLSPKYFIPENFHLHALSLVVAWFFIIAVVWWLLTRDCGRSSAALFGLAWLFVFWLPVSGLFSIPSAPLADRYLYLPAVGLWLLVGDLFDRYICADSRFRVLGRSTAIILFIALAVVTIRHNRVWRSDITLFTHLVDMYPDHAFGHHNLGCAYMDKEKNLDLAERSFQRALSLDPFFPRLRTQMGYVRLLRGDFEGAIYNYNQAIYLNAVDSEALLNRGLAFEQLGMYDDALDSYRRFLATPGNELATARTTIAYKVHILEMRLGGQ